MSNLYGNFRTRTFSEIWDNADDFVSDYENNGLPALISTENANTLYYLLYSKFGNSHIASSDEERFKYSLFRVVWEYGPAWQKKLELQAKLRGFSETELLEGSKQIYNSAQNPSSQPGTFSDEELKYINNQNVAKAKKGKLEAYSLLLDMLEDDVTEPFLRKFDKLFLTIVIPELPLWYVSDEDEE